MNRYPVPPMGYVRYDYSTSASTSPSSSPSPDRSYAHFAPHHKTPTAPPFSRRPTKRHSRKESYSSPPDSAGWQPQPVYPSPEYYASLPRYHAPHGRDEPYVSLQAKSGRFYGSSYSGGGGGYSYSFSSESTQHAHLQPQTQRKVFDTSDEADDLPTYTNIKPRTSQRREKYARDDPYVSYNQSGAYDDSSDSLRPQRSSYSTKPIPDRAVATAAQATRAGIPANYSLKNWDPAEAPILLLGSVFDAHSLGKWIFDWTTYHKGRGVPIAEVAGELWVLLIKLAGHMQRADECLNRVRKKDDYIIVSDFLRDGDELWGKFADLLKTCEARMLSAATDGGKRGGGDMGKQSGRAFVDCMFGRDLQMEETEIFMQDTRLWVLKFEEDCDPILEKSSRRTRRS